MNDRLRNAWRAFANIAIVFSFVVNLVLVLALIVAITPLFRAKSEILEPLLVRLDGAFLGLGETNIETTVDVSEPIPIQFDLPLDQQLGLDFDLLIDQQTVVVLTEPVPLNVPATFTLPGFGGAINGNVSLRLPSGMRLPVRLNMMVPVEKTIPVQMTVPVDQMVDVTMRIPVNIQLGEAGLDPAVQRLRDVFAPLRALLESLPSSIAEIFR
jgi:hypothetical protein